VKEGFSPRVGKNAGVTRARVLFIALALAVVATGCGGGGKKSTTITSATAAKTPEQLLLGVKAALERVHSYRLRGTQTDKDGPSRITGDVELPGKAQLTLNQGPRVVDVILIGPDTYFKANSAFWRHLGQAKAARLLGNRWVKAPTANAGFSELSTLTDPQLIGRCLVGGAHGTLRFAGRGTANGQAAVVIADRGDVPGDAPGKLWVAATGPPLPLRAVQTGPERPGGKPDKTCHETSSSSTTTASNILIGDYDQPVSISPPPSALDLSALTGQQAA